MFSASSVVSKTSSADIYLLSMKMFLVSLVVAYDHTAYEDNQQDIQRRLESGANHDE